MVKKILFIMALILVKVKALDPTLTVGTPLQSPYYSATTSTDSATTNMAQWYTFTVCSLGHINIADCDSSRCGSGNSVDQYISLYSNTNSAEVAHNDDHCNLCSTIDYDKYSATCESFTLKQGCYDTKLCDGMFTITLTDFDAPTVIPTYNPTPTPLPSSQPSSTPSNQPSDNPSSQPNQAPTSAPSFKAESWGEVTTDIRRTRSGGLCDNHCSHHGTCEKNSNCNCYVGLDGEPEWTGPDCSLRTCPKDFAWVGSVVGANDLHPWVECSNKGKCDRASGICDCFPGYDGVACQRTTCPEDDCNGRGTCWPERILASNAGREYSTPWDAMKQIGCYCDPGYRGAACELQECPSGSDPLDGYGNEAGRDCSGRGICNYNSGTCDCFKGFFGTRCQHQTTVF